MRRAEINQAGRAAEPATLPGAKRFALSVDVEDYFQVWAFSGVVARSDWDAFDLRVEASTERLLALFANRGATATFFILGWIAERAPRLVRRIADLGHEVASHGYDHAKVFDQSPDEFQRDVLKAKRILEDAAGVGVKGFRAAGFSFGPRTPWAHEILAETGHVYSSSTHPIAHDHYGDPKGARAPFMKDGVIEAPVAVADVLGARVACAGGGWFRAAPYPVAKALYAFAASSIDGPAIFYLHPWEIDHEQPRISNAPVRSRVRHYLNIDRMERKLDRLLADFNFTRIDDALGLSDSARPWRN